MPAVPIQRTPARPGALLARLFAGPSRRSELIFWGLVLAGVAGLRWGVASRLPTYVWTRDSGSYVFPAITWLDGSPWVTSARRGPVYSLFLALIFRAGGTLRTVADVQAVLGGFTTLLTLGAARLWLGRRAFWPVAGCALFFVLYGMPVELERLVRNETLLGLFATVAFGAWFCVLRTGRASWLALSGLAAGLMQLLKGIFPIFPLIVLGVVVWQWWGRPRRAAALGTVFLVLFLLPLVSSKLYSRLSGTTRPAEPEDGQMFYGRTAQWTYLEPDGILPDLKARIHDQAFAYAERYRRTGKLENNDIVKRTVVPTLKTVIVNERGGTLVEVNRVSWRLGLEAVRHHPGAYLRQFLHDLQHLNFVTAHSMTPFEPRALANAGRDAGRDAGLYVEKQGKGSALTARVFDLPRSTQVLRQATRPDGTLQRYAHRLRALGRLRPLSPVALTTLLLPLLVWRTRGRHQAFWIGNVLLWFYYLVLLSTVGRPLDRYMMPVLPVMFWTVATAASLGWEQWRRATGQANSLSVVPARAPGETTVQPG